MTSAPPNTKGQVLVVARSAPLRSLLVQSLKGRNVETLEAVSASDALRMLTRDKGEMPEGFVLHAPSMPAANALHHARSLASLQITRDLPTVVVVDNQETKDELSRLAESVNIVPVLEHGSADGLLSAILEAHQKAAAALRTSPPIWDDEEQTRRLSSEQRQALTKLDHAYGYFEDVLQRVKRDDLPGPILPTLLQEVRALFADSSVDFNKVVDFVRKHQGLSARLMALANTVYYGRGRRVESLDHAMSRVGLTKASALLHAVAAQAFVVGRDPLLRSLIMESLMKAYLVALLSEELARFKQHPRWMDVYSVGLFHNIGSTFFLYTLALLFEEDRRDVDPEALRIMVDNRNDTLNRMVIETMKLPVEVLRLFPDGDAIATDATDSTVHIVRQAVWLADQVLAGEQALEHTAEAELMKIEPEALEVINGKLEDLRPLIQQYGS